MALINNYKKNNVKIIYYVFWVFILTGCAKNSDSPTTTPTATTATVTYSFAANVSGNYSFTYLVPKSLADTTVLFTGTTWSKTYTINPGTYANGYVLPLTMNTVTSFAGQIRTLAIGVNNSIKASGSTTLTNPNCSILYNYTIIH